jgi:predicted membrane-bound spermidine synthase
VKNSAARSAPAGLPPGLRRYLYFTAAVTGAVVMIVEILGAKMLSPYVGTSHFVWTAQIAVTLVALASGYYAGGWLVSRSPRPAPLYWAVLIAAVYLAATVRLCEPVAYWCLDLSRDGSLAVGSLLASALLYFVPLSLLAMVGPFFVHVLTSTVAGVGGNVGRLTAISTLGSFVGTILIGYFIIPFLPNSQTMFLTSLLLMLVCAGYLFGWGRKSSAPGRAALVLLAGAATGVVGVQSDRFQHATFVELFRGNSDFGRLQVLTYPDSPQRFYLNDFLWQNTYDAAAGKSLSMFTYALHDFARAYTTNLADVLCIGLGVGVVPMEFAREGVRVDVVEINPAVVPVAQKFFDLKPEQLNIAIGDGRYFVNRCQKKYDAVVLDAFLGDSNPSHLMTREAFAGVRRVLRPGGVLVINCFGKFETGKDYFTASLDKTLRAAFTSVVIHAAANGNTFFVAGAGPELKILRAPDLDRVHPIARGQVKSAFDTLRSVDPQQGRVLTDDFNPVDFFDAANREETRRSLAISMKPPDPGTR